MARVTKLCLCTWALHFFYPFWEGPRARARPRVDNGPRSGPDLPDPESDNNGFGPMRRLSDMSMYEALLVRLDRARTSSIQA